MNKIDSFKKLSRIEELIQEDSNQEGLATLQETIGIFSLEKVLPTGSEDESLKREINLGVKGQTSNGRRKNLEKKVDYVKSKTTNDKNLGRRRN